MSGPGSSYKADVTGHQIETSSLDGHLVALYSLSPYVDRSFPKDDWSKGVRLNRLQLHSLPLMKDYQRLVTNVTRNEQASGHFSFNSLNIPNPPPTPVLSLWQLMDLTLKGNTGMHYPFYTWGDYQAMWKWMNSIMKLDHDEDYWKLIAGGTQGMAYHLEGLSSLCATFTDIGNVYGTILTRYGKKGGFGKITQEWWNYQTKMITIETADGMYEQFMSIVNQIPHAPHYPIPNQSEFRIVTEVAWNEIRFHKPISGDQLLPLRGYFRRALPDTYTLLTIYSYAFNEVYGEFVKQRGTLELLVCAILIKDWANLIGLDGLMNYNYILLQQKWGVEIPKLPLEYIDVRRVLLDSNNQLPPLMYPGPKESDAQFLQQLEELFGAKEKTKVPIVWLLKTVDLFKTTGFKTPIQESWDWKVVVGKLQDPDQWKTCVFLFDSMIQGAYKVSLLCHKLSNGWKKPYDEWIWNKLGYTKQQQEDVDHQVAPFDGEYVRRRWNQPWVLQGQELKDYLDYQSGPMEHGYPKFRIAKPAEDPSTYQALVNQSQAYYDQWRNLILASPEKLQKYPLKLPIDVVIDNQKTQIINYYPDLGVWHHEEGSPWKQAINFLFNPWKELTGQSLLQDILGQVKKIVNVLWPLLAKVVDDLTNDVTKLALPALALGAVFIFGLKEVNRFQENKKATS